MTRRLAQLAACLLASLALAGAADAQELGRLFTTPQQRASLDELRRQAAQQRPVEMVAEAAPEPAPAPQPATPGVDSLVVNGIVRRSGGRSTVWINGDQVQRGEVTRDGIRVEPQRRGRQVQVHLPSGVHSIELKPGQKIDVESGTVMDAFEHDPGEHARSAFSDASGERPELESKPLAGDGLGALIDPEVVRAVARLLPEDAARTVRRLLGDEDGEPPATATP